MIKNRLNILMVCLCFAHTFLHAQNRKIQFQNISVEDGISDNRIDNIFQDKEGFLWFSTRLGIDRFNGQTTKTYHLPTERIEVNELLQDKKERIWAVTTGGLFLFNVQNEKFEKWPSQDCGFYDLLDGNILSLLELDNGIFWCSTASGSIVSISVDNNTGEVIYKLDGDKIHGTINYVTDLLLDEGCNIWMGTNQGNVIKYKDSKFIVQEFSPSQNTYINTLAMDKEGHLWIGTNGNGLYKFNSENGFTSHYTKTDHFNKIRSTDNIVLTLLVDNDGNLWVGTDGGGLYLYSSEKDGFTNFLYNRNNNFSIADNSILNLYQGENDIIWMGTVHGGVSYFKNNIKITQVLPANLAFNKADVQGSVMLEASNGDLWLSAGRDGLRRYNPENGKVTVFIDNPENDDDLSGNNVLSLYEDDQKRVWIGTLNGGLNIYDVQNNKFLKPEGRFESRAIFAIQNDLEGKIWVGSNTGIRVYNPSLQILKKYSITTDHQLSSDVVTCLYKDIKGDMWVGTSLGLNLFKKDTIIAYHSIKDDPSTLSGNRIISITEDNDLSLLIGTYGYGLNRYTRSSDNFKRIGKKEGLEGNIIEGIFLDQKHDVWCSTNLGLSKIFPDGTIENYGVTDGVQVFHGGSAIITRKGEIAMCGPFGLFFIKATDLKPENLPAPKIFFTSVSILGENGERVIPLKSKNDNGIIMGPEDNLLSVQYSNSNFWNRKNDKYRYKMEGLNGEWQAIGNQQLLTFSNLKPGGYTLKIGSTIDKVGKNAEIASMKIIVLPSFWQKPWVQIVILLLCCSLTILLFRWRVSRIKKQRKKLQTIIATKTEEAKQQQEEVYRGRIALLNVEKKNQSLKQDRLKDELNFKTEELTNITLRAIHKNDLLTEIKNKLLETPQDDSSKKENLKKIINLIEDSLTFDKDWENFYDLFDQINPTFIKNLKNRCPSLSEREIKLCALIKLNFKSEHIATLFGISLSSVKVARHRLRKKLCIPENGNFHDFFDYLIKLA